MANPELQAGALAKPVRGTMKRLKAKAKRGESTHALSVRAQCVIRDWHCLLMHRRADSGWPDTGLCGGPSEWAHIGKHRRCHTRGQAPAARHTTAGSAMLCQRHHAAYDAHAFDLEPTTVRGMDGPFRVVTR